MEPPYSSVEGSDTDATSALASGGTAVPESAPAAEGVVATVAMAAIEGGAAAAAMAADGGSGALNRMRTGASRGLALVGAAFGATNTAPLLLDDAAPAPAHLLMAGAEVDDVEPSNGLAPAELDEGVVAVDGTLARPALAVVALEFDGATERLHERDAGAGSESDSGGGDSPALDDDDDDERCAWGSGRKGANWSCSGRMAPAFSGGVGGPHGGREPAEAEVEVEAGGGVGCGTGTERELACGCRRCASANDRCERCKCGGGIVSCAVSLGGIEADSGIERARSRCGCPSCGCDSGANDDDSPKVGGELATAIGDGGGEGSAAQAASSSGSGAGW